MHLIQAKDACVILPESSAKVGRIPSRTSTPTRFGLWLSDNRKLRGLTGERLAEAADTASAVISNLERGIRNPSRDMVRRLATALCSFEKDPNLERTAKVYAEGMEAAGFIPEMPATEEDIARKKDILWDAYNKTTGARRIAADAILFTNEETGEQFTLDDIARITRPRDN